MTTRTGMLAAGLAALLAPLAVLANDAPKAAAPEAGKKAEPVRCETLTGSRIRPRKETGCQANRPLRTFTKEQLDLTGNIDIIEALRDLDPVFR